MHSGHLTVLEKPGLPPEDSLQKLLLQFSDAVARGLQPDLLMQMFCRSAREFFQVDGAYFWEFASDQELAAAQADGLMARSFPGLRLKAKESAVAMEAIRQRKTVYMNRPDPARHRIAAEFHAKSLMAAPLIVSNEVIGAAVFLHASDPNFFNDDMAAKATILAGQLGNLLEARRRSQISAQEHRRAKALHELTEAVQEVNDIQSVAQALADHLRNLLGNQLVCVLLRHAEALELDAVSAESPQLAASVRARWNHKGIQFAVDLARRALAAGEAITVAIDPAAHVLKDHVSPGALLAVPVRACDTEGAILVYPRRNAVFTREEKSLASAVAGMGALALANSQLYESARKQAQESEQHRRRADSLMRLALELNSQRQLPAFVTSFVRRAAELMEAKAAALAIKQDAVLQTIAFDQGPPTDPQTPLLRRLDATVAELLRQDQRAIISGDAAQILGAELASNLGWRDCHFVRLLNAPGELVGVLSLIDRGKPLDAEDLQLLKALAAHAAVALENARLFTRMDQANRHWIEIFDAITDFIVAHDSSDHVLRVNRSLASFIGVQPHELMGVEMGALLAMGEETPSGCCPFCPSTTDLTISEYVHSALNRTYLVSTSRVQGGNGEGLQTIHVLKDITDRREAERRYHELFDNIQEGVFFATPEGRFVEVNDALVQMLGYAGRGDLLQADIRTQVCFSVEQYDELADQLQRRGAVRNLEQTLRRRDGSVVHVLISAFAVRDAQERTVQYRGVMLDISGLKTSQSELQRERDFSGKILNNTQSLILVADAAGQISYANRRWYEMGYERQQLLGRHLEELIAPARRPALHQALSATLAGQQVDNLELQIVRGGGHLGHFSVNLSPIRDEQDNVASIVVVMSDISDVATLQAKLMHAEKMAAVGQLVSGVAHEVNNPLTAILGFADLLLENPELPESAHKDLRVILQEAQRTKQIVQNLLSFARQMPPQRKPVQLNPILRRTIQLRAYDFHSRGIEVNEQLDENLPLVIGDAHQLQQVFLNILNNAYDAMRDTGRPARIAIASSCAGNTVEVSFCDNGHGIYCPDRIFDPFFTTKEVGKGTGLGLSICWGIVREHGGEISCHNNSGGPGATFVVRLPALEETAGGNATE